jgi:alpha-beta hydrolase superfamily lysophospholipase
VRRSAALMPGLPPIHRWDSISQPRASVHILHGMAEHGRRYARLAGDLNRAGFVVWAHDHRGHGTNATPPVGLGHFGDTDGWRALVGDAWAVSEHMRATFPGLPLVLFAHSMGSFLGQTLMAERGTAYRAVVLSGTNGPSGIQEALARGLAHAQYAALGGRRPGKWLDKAVMGTYNRRFAPNRTKFDWLSRDEREVDAYAADPLCGFTLTTQSWVDFLTAKTLLGDVVHLRRIPRALPVHLIAGTRDPVGEESRGVERLLRVYNEAGLARVTCRFYDGARHELVNETNRDEVTRDLIEVLGQLGC